MKIIEKEKPKEETVKTIDVELNDEQLEGVAGGTNWPNFADIIDKIKNPPIPD